MPCLRQNKQLRVPVGVYEIRWPQPRRGRALFTCRHMAPDADACTRPVGAGSAHPPLRRGGDSLLPRGPRENVTGGQGGLSPVHASIEPTWATGPPASRGRIGRDHVCRLAATSRTATAAASPRLGPRTWQAAGGRPVARARGRGWRSATSAPGRERTRRSARRGAASARESPGRPGLPCRGLGYPRRCPATRPQRVR